MRNRLLILLVGGLFGFSCGSQTDGFKVSIQLENAPDCQVFVSELIPNNKQWYVDTLKLMEGRLLYTGKVDYPRLINFNMKKGNDDIVSSSFSIFLDNNEVCVRGNFDDLENLIVRGSKTHDEFVSIKKNERILVEECERIIGEQNKANRENNQKLLDSLLVVYKQAKGKLFDYFLSIPGYAHSEVTPYFIWSNARFDDGMIDLMEQALNAFDTSLARNAYVAHSREILERVKRVQPGAQAYDFTLEDLEGNTYKLSDFRGKYVLLEFSASWCGGCKKEIPFLKTVYKNTSDKDFVMFTINVDNEREKWAKDVEQHKLPWTVLSDLKAFDSPVVKNYNVGGIPAIYLIDPDGKIKKTGLRREKMIEYINTLFD